MPDLAVVSAGSLLEFALAEIPSFGIAGEAFASYEKIRVVPLYAAENLRILLDKIEADR